MDTQATISVKALEISASATSSKGTKVVALFNTCPKDGCRAMLNKITLVAESETKERALIPGHPMYVCHKSPAVPARARVVGGTATSLTAATTAKGVVCSGVWHVCVCVYAHARARARVCACVRVCVCVCACGGGGGGGSG